MFEVSYGFVVIARFRSVAQVNRYVARITWELKLDGNLFKVQRVADSGNEWVNPAY